MTPSGHVENDNCCKHLRTLKQFLVEVILWFVCTCDDAPSLLQYEGACCFSACFSRQISQKSRWRAGGGRARVYFCLSGEGTQQVFPHGPPSMCLSRSSGRQHKPELKKIHANALGGRETRSLPDHVWFYSFSRSHQQPPGAGRGGGDQTEL